MNPRSDGQLDKSVANKLTPLVIIVTLNWNQKNSTLECLDSLVDQNYPNLRILVVDNGSKDGSVQAIAEKYPEIEQVVNPQNLGFAKGFNIGLQHAMEQGADCIFILNNDTIADRECVSELVEKVNKDSGILAPLIYYADQPELIWSTGGKISPWTLEKKDTWAGKRDSFEWLERIEQDFVPGCAMFFPRHTLERVGLFDEGFYLYYEDSDLCRRVRQQRMHITVIPKAKIWHKVSRSSGGSDSETERYWMARSSVRYFRKHATPFKAPIIIFWRTGSAIRTTFRLLLQKKWPALRAYWKGIRDGLQEAIR